jgi:hypothetical protein
VPEGLSASEVGKEIAEHQRHEAANHAAERHDRRIAIVEAIILSCVAVLAAYSGFAAAKWGTESSLSLARASAQRTKASRAELAGLVTRSLDSASFNAWFTAFTAGHATAQRLAIKRMRPGYKPAFFAWLATDPAHNPNAPAGPAYMPQYVIAQDAAAKTYDAKAEEEFAKGEHAGGTSDDYVRDTVFLATVLFLVGISGHFRVRQARYAIVTIGVLLLGFSVVQLLGLPAPP